MLIALEGIDGSGKTTTAALLADELRARGLDAAHIDKRAIDGESEYANEHLAGLSRLIWTTSRNAPIKVLGHDHWVFINAAYHCGLYEAVIKPASEQGKVLVVDGWIYKFAARAAVTGEVHPRHVLAQMAAVPRPDLVIMLDVPAEEAFTRRQSFNAMEAGGWSDKALGFVQFQTSVSAVLKEIGSDLDWVMTQPAGLTAAEVAMKAADIVQTQASCPAPGAAAL